MGDQYCMYNECDEVIENGGRFVRLSGGTVKQEELSDDAGGGLFHPECAIEYINQKLS